jgi:uncharacterized YccA/Bax inhibitor family protein
MIENGKTTDIIAGWVTSNGDVSIQAYAFTIKDAPTSVHPTLILQNTQGSQADGATVIYFTRPLTEGATQPISNTNQYVIGAHGGPDVDGLAYHNADRTNLLLSTNFFTGAISSKDMPLGIRDAHAIIMFISWGLILPFGVLFARYTKSLKDNLWFTIHRPSQGIGFLLSLAGIIIAYYMVGPTFTMFRAHGILGTIIFIFSIIQIVVAIFRPHKDQGKRVTNERYAFEIFHQWNGRLLVLSAVAQIFLGIEAIGYHKANPWLIPLYAALVGLTLGVVIIVEIINCVRPMGSIVPCFYVREDKDEYYQAEFS